jgi:hypothetical protein
LTRAPRPRASAGGGLEHRGERRVRVGLVEQVDGELDRPALRRPDGGAPERGEELERAAVVGQDVAVKRSTPS